MSMDHFDLALKLNFISIRNRITKSKKREVNSSLVTFRKPLKATLVLINPKSNEDNKKNFLNKLA